MEDDPHTQEIIAEIFKPLCQKLFIASDGEEGLTLYKEHHPDIVLTDIQMPRMDGLTMSRAIQKLNPDTPIIISSAFNESEYLHEAIRSGIHYYLLKPVNMTELNDTFKRVSEKILLQKELKKSRHLLNEYKAVVDVSSMVTKTDPKGIITYANDAFCEISGFSHEELIGRQHNIVRHPDTPQETFKAMWQTIQNKEHWHGIIKNQTKSGSSFIADSTIIPILDTSGEVIEFISIRYDVTEREVERERLEKHKEYSSYQEELAFKKQLNIIRNDYYYKLCDDEIRDGVCLIDSYYKPLDILCGDTYSIRRLGDDINFYMIIDGMGKGVSASLTAMLLTAYINHTIDQALHHNKPLSLDPIITQALAYIRPILLEDEIVSAHFIRVDRPNHLFEYASFSMPAILTLDYKGNIHKTPSNNPPISKYGSDFKIDQLNGKMIRQTLIYSDGLVENSLKDTDDLYMSYIEEDFSKALTRDDMHRAIEERLGPQEDDMTFIFLSKFEFEKHLIATKSISCSMSALGEADQWYAEQLDSYYHNQELLDHAGYAFTELLLNAYEHGNLGITGREKHHLIESGDYWDVLGEREQECDKQTLINLYNIDHLGHNYLVTMITDEGEGFDTQLLHDIFYRANNFNGRGVYISRRSSNGIYYNAKGNSVFTINKISTTSKQKESTT